MPIDAVSEMLWRERRLLELLLFKLEEEQLVLAAGRNRWLAHATRELETVFEEINVVELERAVSVNAAARWLGLESDASLKELAVAAPEPWDRLLDRHRDALVTLAAEIDVVAEANHELLGESANVPDPVRVPDNVLQLQLQRVAHDAASGVTRAVQPSLMEFLR